MGQRCPRGGLPRAPVAHRALRTAHLPGKQQAGTQRRTHGEGRERLQTPPLRSQRCERSAQAAKWQSAERPPALPLRPSWSTSLRATETPKRTPPRLREGKRVGARCIAAGAHCGAQHGITPGEQPRLQSPVWLLADSTSRATVCASERHANGIGVGLQRRGLGCGLCALYSGIGDDTSRGAGGLFDHQTEAGRAPNHPDRRQNSSLADREREQELDCAYNCVEGCVMQPAPRPYLWHKHARHERALPIRHPSHALQ